MSSWPIPSHLPGAVWPTMTNHHVTRCWSCWIDLLLDSWLLACHFTVRSRRLSPISVPTVRRVVSLVAAGRTIHRVLNVVWGPADISVVRSYIWRIHHLLTRCVWCHHLVARSIVHVVHVCSLRRYHVLRLRCHHGDHGTMSLVLVPLGAHWNHCTRWSRRRLAATTSSRRICHLASYGPSTLNGRRYCVAVSCDGVHFCFTCYVPNIPVS